MYSIPAHCNVLLNTDHHVNFTAISRKDTNKPNRKQIQRQEEHA